MPPQVAAFSAAYAERSACLAISGERRRKSRASSFRKFGCLDRLNNYYFRWNSNRCVKPCLGDTQISERAAPSSQHKILSASSGFSSKRTRMLPEVQLNWLRMKRGTDLVVFSR